MSKPVAHSRAYLEAQLVEKGELEAEVTRLKKQLEYGDVTPASSVAAEVAVLRENNEALGLKVNELEAAAAAMRERLKRAEEQLAGPENQSLYPQTQVVIPDINKL